MMVDEKALAVMNSGYTKSVVQFDDTSYGYKDPDEGSRPFGALRMQLVHPVSKIADQFDRGSLVLNKSELLYTRPKVGSKHADIPLNVIVILAMPYWEEWVRSAAKPREWLHYKDAAAALEAEGKSMDWTDGPDGKRVGPAAALAVKMRLLVEKPDGLISDSFPLELNGKFYTLADLKANKQSTDSVDRPLRMRHKAGKPLHGCMFNLSSELKGDATKGAEILRFTMVHEFDADTVAKIDKIRNDVSGLAQAED